jgi:putative transposase
LGKKDFFYIRSWRKTDGTESGGEMAVSIPLKGSLSADCEKIESLEDLMDEHRILKQLIERLVERGLEVDLAHHLRYAGHEPVVYSTSNAYTGKSQKTLKRRAGKRPLAVRGARRGGFAPWIIPKRQAGLRDFGYKIPPACRPLAGAWDSGASRRNAWR